MPDEHKLLPVSAAHVRLQIEIAAPVSHVWKTMIEDIGQWWRPDFLVCEGSEGINLEPRIGGLLSERSADGGFVWGQVLSFQPDTVLSFTTQIVPPWGGPAFTVVQITLAPDKANPDTATRLVLTDSLIGHLTDEMLGNMEDGWKQLFGEGGLKSFAEGLQ